MRPRAYAGAILSIVLASFLFALVMAPRIPDPAPMHWNWRNEVDRYGPRWVAIALMPSVVAGVAALCLALSRSAAFREFLARSRAPFARLSLGVLFLFASLGGLVQVSASGARFDFAPVVVVLTSLLTAFVGAALRDVRRNPWVGIRTPSTLASDEVWEATHRAGSRLFVVHGLLSAASAFVLPAWGGLVVLIAGLLALVVWSFAYSRRLRARLSFHRSSEQQEIHRGS
jgi:uncharacterized membrane protein